MIARCVALAQVLRCASSVARVEAPVGAEDLDRVLAVERWLLNGTRPAQWTVFAERDVTRRDALTAGASKRVSRGRAGSGGDKVVVKTLVVDAAHRCPNATACGAAAARATVDASKRRDHVLAELYYLEGLRGRPGVPRLYGGWRDPLSIVVADGGSELTSYPSKRTRHQPSLSPAWKAFCAEDPVAAAVALLECFRSFAEYGGFFLSDFSPHQFTLRGSAVFLVDGPDALDGAVAAFLRDRGLDAGLRRPFRAVDADRACAASCPSADPPIPRNVCCCARARRGECASAAERDACGADRRRCFLISRKPHTHDAGTAWWALPAVVDRAPKGAARTAVAAVAARLAAPDPGDRPTFSEAVASLREGRPPTIRGH